MTPERFRALLEALLSRPLTPAEARELADAMLAGELGEVEVAAVLAGLRGRGEEAGEVAGFAEAMRGRCRRVVVDEGEPIDTAGTGGDRSHTVNASTAAAITVAALGGWVLKHGNRSVSSRSGSADFMEALGYPIEHGPEEARCIYRGTRFAFLYAPMYHPAMRNVMPVRRRLGVRTIFNLVGPLSNPGMVRRQLLGVASESLVPVMLAAAGLLGYEHVVIVHGEPGLDEVSVSGATRVVEYRAGRGVEEYTVTPEDLGLARHSVSELKALDARDSVAKVMAVWRGSGSTAVRDFLAANAGFALYLAGLASTPRDGVEAALQAYGEGRVASYVERLVEVARRCVSKSAA